MKVSCVVGFVDKETMRPIKMHVTLELRGAVGTKR